MTINLYRRKGQWRWSIRHSNTKIIGASSEAYTKRSGCLMNLYLVTGFIVRVEPRRTAASFTASNVARGMTMTV